jgi:integrase/recombinase XerD
MALLQSGVDIAVIAPWLGHESIETTNVYVHANLAMKEKALAKVAPIGRRFRRIIRRTITCWRSWNRSDYQQVNA